MSSDLERLLREGWDALPGPEPEPTERARARALAAITGRRRRRLRSRLLLVGALVLAVVAGAGIGASVAPSGSAAEGPVGFGFLPQHGWYVVQNGARATPDRPALAIASNVPLEPGDGSSIVPYATLRSLPADGVVLVASFIEQSGAQSFGTNPLPTRRLPLRVEDALAGILWGVQIRPEQPLGQYQLRGTVKGYAVDLHLYFGTPEPSDELRAEAQHQLDRLVVTPDTAATPRATGPTLAPSSTQSVTIAFVRYYDNACRCYKARVSGRISSGQAGEYVVVLRQYCGRSFSTAVAGATTSAGGFWETELPIVSRPDALVSESYRARWDGNLSEPVAFRGKLGVEGARRAGGAQAVSVLTGSNNPVKLKGRQVVLQRRVGGAWGRLATARLAPHRTAYYTFVATFRVPRRGWALRAVVPSRAARPCFTASVSETWKS